jgi:hypothetical protein
LLDQTTTPSIEVTPLGDAQMNDKQDRIRQRAYEIWQRSGQPEGLQEDHWFQATREIDAEEERGVSSLAGTDAAFGERSGANRSANITSDASVQSPPSLVAPKMAGASKPGPDMSRSPTANRNVQGLEK